MKFCKKCVYPISAVNIDIDKSGICTSCLMFEKSTSLGDQFWKERKSQFLKLSEEVLNKNKSNYDCLIPVSGGKDSYYQAYLVAEKYGLKPLLMTYHGNNFLPEGDYNRDRMRHNFNADHIVWGPSVNVLKKLNRLAFKKMGDMNWQNHCGIFTAPINLAVKFNIPLIFWGEIAWDISGMYSAEDFAEFSARVRNEHGLRGYEWYDFLNDPVDKITEKDMMWAKYPSDEEILKVGVRGIYLGNFFKWDPNAHSKLIVEKYNWKKASEPFERTYRQFSNLDDRYENGVHDLLKFIKFGYGRCSDHASKDIRTGYMTRKKAIEMVRKYDHVVSSDLYHWLNYVEMEEEEFWHTADTFRDPRVWRIKDGEWCKDNVWGEEATFGKVNLTQEEQKKFKKEISKKTEYEEKKIKKSQIQINKKKNILGLSIGEHCSASLLIDGKIVGASYEERFHRKKCYSGFPYRSIKYLLNHNGLSEKDIDAVAVVNETLTGLEFSMIQRFTSFSVDDYIREAHEFYKPILFEGKKKRITEVFKDKVKYNVFPDAINKRILKEGETLNNSKEIRKDLIYKFLKRKDVEIQFVNHHTSHALYGYLASPKNCGNALIFTADSFGDNCNSNVYKTSGGKLECIYSSGKHNLGRLFRNITLLMGMKPYQHEYKVMGLAPYASKEYAEKVKKILSSYMSGFDGDWIFNKVPKDNFFTFQKEFEGIRFDNIAGGLQSYFEDRILEWFEWFLKREKNFKSIIFSGGLAMNVKVNLRLDNLAKKYKKRFFVAPSADDYSHCISAAFFPLMNKNYQLNEKTKPGTIKHLDLGYLFSEKDDSQIISWARKKRWKVKNFSSKLAAKILKEKKILGLCHGSGEFGARALGFRSIVADPSDFKIVRRINVAIKNRDFWMPFAPAILEGKEAEYIKIRERESHRYMAAAADTTKKGSNLIEAATHPYDQTARPQIVSKKFNSHFYNIIKSFGKLTGVYALLNTSLNLHGYPIVNNSEDLIFVLENSELDGCILKNSIIFK